MPERGNIPRGDLKPRKNTRNYKIKNTCLVVHDAAGQPQYGDTAYMRQQKHGPGKSRRTVTFHHASGSPYRGWRTVVGIDGHAPCDHNHLRT